MTISPQQSRYEVSFPLDLFVGDPTWGIRYPILYAVTLHTPIRGESEKRGGLCFRAEAEHVIESLVVVPSHRIPSSDSDPSSDILDLEVC